MKTQNKKEQYEKIVEWENEEFIWIPLFVLFFWSIGYIMGTYPFIYQEIHLSPIIFIIITLLALGINTDEVTRKVYFVKKE